MILGFHSISLCSSFSCSLHGFLVSNLGLSNLDSVHGSNQRLWIELGSNGEAGVSYTEPESVSDILDLLEQSVGVNIGVCSGDSTVGVTDLVLDGVEVVVAVLEVAELILGVELRGLDLGNLNLRNRICYRNNLLWLI